MIQATEPHLSVSSRIEKRLQQGELKQEQVNDFHHFLAEVNREFCSIPSLLTMPILIGFNTAPQPMKNCGISSSNFRFFQPISGSGVVKSYQLTNASAVAS